MTKEQTARELFEEATKHLAAAEPERLKHVQDACCAASAWNKPFESWDQASIKAVKKSITETLRDQLAYSERYEWMAVFNQLLHDHVEGSVPLDWGKLTERVEVETEILKLTQGGTNPDLSKQTREALAEKLHFTPEALKPYLTRLQKGKLILGSKVSIELARASNVYDSTVHPVFLALNLTEVNFLVNHLRLQCKGSSYEPIAEQIAYDVYRQLSVYAKSRMDAVAKNNGIDMDQWAIRPDLKPGYRSEADQKQILYYLKARKCRLTPIDHPTEAIPGRVIWKNDNSIVFRKEDGTELKLDERTLGEYDIKIDNEIEKGS